jgi:outer membrane protein OmpA-like peptidoglycan-associated protein
MKGYAWLICLAAVGCGGTIQFQDSSAIGVMGTPPPPPPADDPPPEPRVEVRDDRIVIREKIQFAYNSARILEGSFDLLEEIAKVMNENPQIKKIEIGGHASSEGSADYNMNLSDRRAKAVQKHLTTIGKVDATRLTAKGYGVTQPLVANDDTEEKRERNRRVEFLITEQEVTKKKVAIDPKTGEETVVEKTKKVLKEGE